MYIIDRNSLMHSVVRHSTQNPAISRHWQYHLHILVLLHLGWCRQNVSYTPLDILLRYQSSSKLLSRDQYANNHSAQAENVSPPAECDPPQYHR